MRPSACVRHDSAAGLQRLQQRARRDAHLHQVVEAVVEQDLRVEHHDHVDAGEHLEHLFVQEEVDRARSTAGRCPRSRRCTCRPSRHIVQAILYGPMSEAVVADVVLEVLLASRAPCGGSARASRACCARAWRPSPSRTCRRRSASAISTQRMRGRAQRRDDRVEVGEVPGRQAAVVQDDLAARRRCSSPALKILTGGIDDAFLVDRARVGRQRAGHLAADVGHVAEHRRPGDDAAVLVDRHQHQPVVRRG